MLKFWKKKKENKKQIKDNEILNFSENIVNRAFQIDKWGKRFLKYSIISFFFIFYFGLFYLNPPKSESDIYFYNSQIFFNILLSTLKKYHSSTLKSKQIF